MNEFQPSLTGETKFGIGAWLAVWLFMTLIGINTRGIHEIFGVSIIFLAFIFLYIYLWLKQTYVVISDNKVKYVSFFIQRKTADISDIKMITTSDIAGFIKGLCIIYYPNGKEKLLQISPIGFSKQTLNEFVSELTKINPKIEVHKSTEELLIDKPNKSLTRYQVIGLVGAIFSGVLIFIGVSYNKHIELLALLIPLGLFLGVFFIGYGMKGKLKDGFRFVLYFLMFSLAVVVINFLR